MQGHTSPELLSPARGSVQKAQLCSLKTQGGKMERAQFRRRETQRPPSLGTNQLDVGTRTRSAFLSGYLNGLFRMLMVRPLPWKCWLGRSRLRPHLPMGLIFRKFLEQMHQMSSNPPPIRIFKVKSKQVQQNPHWYVPRPLPLKGKNLYQAVSGINILCLLIWPASSEKTSPSCIDRGLLKLIETSSYLRPLPMIERSHFV